MKVLELDGSRFDDFEGFRRAFSELLEDWEWNGSLDAFNDILRGGFGTPEEGFVLRWLHADRSRAALGWPATALRLEGMLGTCHPSNVEAVRGRLDAARRGEGLMLFDEIVEIIRDHGPGGQQAEDKVILELR